MPRELEVHGNGEVVALEQIPGYHAQHQVTPGLTGLAQIFAPRDLPRKQKFRLDLLYVKKQSLMTDIRFIALSFWITFSRKMGTPWVENMSSLEWRRAGRRSCGWGTRGIVERVVSRLAGLQGRPRRRASNGRPAGSLHGHYGARCILRIQHTAQRDPQ